jgi:hypothetical protein
MQPPPPPPPEAQSHTPLEAITTNANGLEIPFIIICHNYPWGVVVVVIVIGDTTILS